MLRTVLFLAACLAAALGVEICIRKDIFSFADQPGDAVVEQFAKITSLTLRTNKGSTPCIDGVNYGVVDGNRIWVDKGCSGRFVACGDSPFDDNPWRANDWRERVRETYGERDINDIAEMLAQRKKQLYGSGCLCNAWGPGHFRGFDGSEIHFQGQCEYILAKSVGTQGDCAFMVSVQTGEKDDGTRLLDRVHIQMFGKIFTLAKGNRLIIDEKEAYGYQKLEDKYEIYQSSTWLQTFRSDACGVEVSYKGDGIIQLYTSSAYTGHMNGLCGNCNGDEVDDYRLSDGSQPDMNEDRNLLIGFSYTNMALKYGVPSTCHQPSSVSPVASCGSIADRQRAEVKCKMLLDVGGPFKKCFADLVHVARQVFDSCFSDVCQGFNLGIETKAAVCQNLAVLAEDCWKKGHLVDYRNAAGCAPDCPPKSTFFELVPAIQPSCTMREQPEWALYDTNEGCLCNPNFLMDKNGCIRSRQCGCIKDDGYMPTGVEITSRNCLTVVTCLPNAEGRSEKDFYSGKECGWKAHCILIDGNRECACKRGFMLEGDGCVKDPVVFGQMRAERRLQRANRLARQKASCTCKIFGDPHIRTHDNQFIHFQGACTYLLSSTKTQGGDCDYQVISKFEHRDGHEEASFVRDVFVLTRGVKIGLMAGGDVKVNGAVRSLPVDLPDQEITITQSGRFVQVVTGCGVQVSFDGEFAAFVETPKVLGGDLQGICGDCNGEKDDIKLAGSDEDISDQPNSHRDVGNSHAVLHPDGVNEPTNCAQETDDLVCTDEMQELADSDGYCGRLTDDEGPFKACLAALPDLSEVESLKMSCGIDVCTYWESPEQLESVLCGANAQLAALCETVGVAVRWRTSDFCPMECPPYSIYNPMMLGCQGDCMNPEPNPAECTLPDREGCECKEGFVLDKGVCIHREDCGCRHENLGYMALDTSFLSADCTMQYVCESTTTGPLLRSIPVVHGSCSEFATCELDDDKQPVCECVGGYTGDGYTCERIPDPEPPVTDPIDPPPPQDDDCVCSASGDPHVITFDDSRLQVFEPCKYTLSATFRYGHNPTDNCDFKIEIKNEIHERHVTQSFIRLVDVKLASGTVIRMSVGRDVFVNDVEIPFATTHNLPEAILTKEDGYVHLVTECGLRVRFDGKMSVDLRVPHELQPRLFGLCGNCNKDKWDERWIGGYLPRNFPGGKIAAFKEIERQYLVPDDSDKPNLSGICTPAR